MDLELWIDVVCPWCCLGVRRLEAALGDFAHRDRVRLTLRSFELDPQAPARIEGTVAEHLARKYGSTLEQVQERQAQLTRLGAEAGIDFRFDRVRQGNSFDAHRLIQAAGAHGVQLPVAEELMRRYFGEGMALDDRAALVAAAAAGGLDADAARAALDGPAYVSEVRADEQRAAALGIRGVPFLVLDDEYGISGAQPAELFLQGLQTAWERRAAAEPA